MGLVKLRIRELAKQNGWTLKEVAARANVPYTTVTTYARSEGMAMADIAAVIKIAQVFGITVEDLVEIVAE
ncbi:MAG: helix-turn-helix transcriptional regulator [Leptolyngbya sp. SIO4C5]|uniref:helix-turn-helix domain-containing protein n=1 Tax=Sphaerothrix gracilis TaxID=3151835 RepID=UPI0013C04637|nr:helix-turn-helix transcriptional regulator [Leptolyngbya sp. SIO4C5]